MMTLTATLPDWIPSAATPLVEALLSPGVLVLVSLSSVGLFVASLLGVTWAANHIPTDYLHQGRQRTPARGVALVGRIARNLLGAVLLAVGVALLILPGQGLLTIVTALLLMDFPGKQRLERRLLSTPAIWRAINRSRKRSGRPPLSRATEAAHPPGEP